MLLEEGEVGTGRWMEEGNVKPHNTGGQFPPSGRKPEGGMLVLKEPR